MLLSPGTVISISIREARLIRNSIDVKGKRCWMPELDEKGNAALIQHPVSRIEH
jgi:hypothetical protein